MRGAAKRQVISYLVLRRAVGVLGIVFPVWLSAWCRLVGDCTEICDSISAYYHTASHDWFVGILCAIAIFLWSYRGPDKQDDIMGDLACLFALGVAMLPTGHATPWIAAGHTASALGLFLVLAYFSLRMFTKGCDAPTPRKLVRNQVYRVCGWIILACIALIGLYNLVGRGTALDALKPVFWLEATALWAFGLSWLTKGEMLWPDRPPPHGPARS